MKCSIHLQPLYMVIHSHPSFPSLRKEDHSSQAGSESPVMHTQCHPPFILICLVSGSKQPSFVWLFKQWLFLIGRFLQPWWYWHFRPDNSLFLCRGVFLCPVGGLAASLASRHQVPGAPSPPVVTTKNVFWDIAQRSPGWVVGCKTAPIWNHHSVIYCIGDSMEINQSNTQ